MIVDGPEMVAVLLAPAGDGLPEASAEEVTRLRRELGDGTVETFDRDPAAPVDQSPYSVVVKAFGASGRLERAISGMRERLGGAVDAAEVLAGRDLAVIDNLPTRGAVTLFYAMYGTAGCTRETFAEHWAHEHAALVQRNPFVRRYHQLHADVERTHRAVQVTGLGSGEVFGIAECDFDSTASFARMASSELIKAESADILSITDAGRNQGVVTRRRT